MVNLVTATADPLQTLKAIDRELINLRKEYAARKTAKKEYEARMARLNKKKKEAEESLKKLIETDEAAAKKLRYRLYENKAVQVLLSGFLGGSVKDLVPIFDAERLPRYPAVESIVNGGEPTSSLGLLDELAVAEILEKKIYERFVCCPSCGRHSGVFMRFKCPSCGSINLESKTLLEHLYCGTVHELEDFMAEDRLTCPKCKQNLSQEGVDYRPVGTFNRCKACRKQFEHPIERFACRSCEIEFTAKEAYFHDVHVYSLNPKLVNEVESVVGIPLFKAALETLGFRVELLGSMIGASGVSHSFTMTAAKDGKSVAIDLAESDKEVDETPVLAFYAKFIDIKPSGGVLIAMPGLSQKARSFAASFMQAQKIRCVEGRNVSEALDRFKNIVGSIL